MTIKHGGMETKKFIHNITCICFMCARVPMSNFRLCSYSKWNQQNTPAHSPIYTADFMFYKLFVFVNVRKMKKMKKMYKVKVGENIPCSIFSGGNFLLAEYKNSFRCFSFCLFIHQTKLRKRDTEQGCIYQQLITRCLLLLLRFLSACPPFYHTPCTCVSERVLFFALAAHHVKISFYFIVAVACCLSALVATINRHCELCARCAYNALYMKWRKSQKQQPINVYGNFVAPC